MRKLIFPIILLLLIGCKNSNIEIKTKSESITKGSDVKKIGKQKDIFELGKKIVEVDRPEQDRDFDPDIYELINDIKDHKIKVEEGKNKKDKILKDKKKDTRSIQWDIFWQEAQYRISDDGYYVSPSQDMQNYLSSPVSQSLSISTTTWTELGPKSWNRTSGWNPGVGLVNSISVNPNDSTDIIAGSAGGGIWRTRDFGVNWSNKTDNNSSMIIIFYVSRNPNNVNDCWATVQNGGVLRSKDGGDTWSLVSTTIWQSPKRVFITSNGYIFVTGSDGIKRSTDDGLTWTLVHNISKEDIQQIPGNPNILFASGSGLTSNSTQCVYKSTDGGSTWVPISLNTFGRTLLGVSPNNPSKIYALQAYGSLFGYLWVTNDGGNTWDTLVTKETRNFFDYSSTGAKGGTGQATYDMAISVNPDNANDVTIAGIHNWRSLDGGLTWTLKSYWSLPNSTGYCHADIHDVKWIGGKIYTGTDGGIYYYSESYKDPITGFWHDLSRGLGIRQFYRIYGNTNASIISGGAQDNGSAALVNGLWKDWLGADGMDGFIATDQIWLGTSQYGNPYKTTNGGNGYGGSLGTPIGSGWWITPYYFTRDGKMYSGHGGMNVSLDTGRTVKILGDTSKYKGGFPYNLSVSYDGSTVYGSVTSLLQKVTNGVTDTIKLPFTPYWVTSFPDNSNHIRVLTSNSSSRVMESFDGGRTYNNISFNYTPTLTPRCAVLDTSTGNYFVGNNIGVFVLPKGGTSWVDYSYNLPKVPVNDIHVWNGKLYVGTFGRGLWSIPLDTTQIVVVNNPPIANAGLDQTVYIPRDLTTTSFTVSGSVSDDNGVPQSYWQEGSTIYPTSNVTPNIQTLSKGVGSYNLILTAIDVINQISKDTVKVTVLDTNTYVVQPSVSVTISGSKQGSVHKINFTTTTNQLTAKTKFFVSADQTTWILFDSTTLLSGSVSYQANQSGARYYYQAVATTSNISSASNIINIKNGGKPTVLVLPSSIVVTAEYPTTYQVFNLQGIVFYKGNIKSGKNTINISNLGNGLYYVKVGEDVFSFLR